LLKRGFFRLKETPQYKCSQALKTRRFQGFRAFILRIIFQLLFFGGFDAGGDVVVGFGATGTGAGVSTGLVEAGL
jgi:hypothetical protein